MARLGASSVLGLLVSPFLEVLIVPQLVASNVSVSMQPPLYFPFPFQNWVIHVIYVFERTPAQVYVHGVCAWSPWRLEDIRAPRPGAAT